VLERCTGYDKLAWFYDRYWGREYPQRALPILDHLLLTRLPQKAFILDLCCGVAHLTKFLTDQGYRVLGLDCSPEMLRYAQQNAPGAEFIVADARSFKVWHHFNAVISTFESLNHILSLEGLTAVFRNVYTALRDEGHFLFDLLMEEAYRTQWVQSASIVEDDDVCIMRGDYDAERRIGRAQITLFRNDGGWRRSDVTILEHCYELGEVWNALEQAGFEEISSYDARRRLGMSGDLGVGRVFFTAKKVGHDK
jgi:SAM-dependent methyltransferase